MAGWVGRPATQIAAAVRAGMATARAVVAEHLARIEALDGELGAFRVLRPQRALAEADAVDAELAAAPGGPAHPGTASTGQARFPLAGVPLGVKDNTAVAGEVPRFGSLATPDTPAVADHEVVRRLRAAGAVVLGLTRMPELGIFPMGDSAWGLPRNPWNTQLTPGGSSGGAAVAVAAGMVPLAQGNDGLGSIRIPAACCGLVGLKPGTGVLPPPGDPQDPWFGLAEHGPLASTVGDAALMLAIMAERPDWAEVDALETAWPLRVAVAVNNPAPGMPVDPQYRDAARAAGQALAQAGHEVRAVRFRYPPALGPAVLSTWARCAAGSVTGLDPRQLTRPVRGHARMGRVLGRLGMAAPHTRECWGERLDRCLGPADVLLTPALAHPPPPAVRWSERGWLRNVVAAGRYTPFIPPWNLAGWPAATVPAATRHRSGIPLAVQLVARPGGEPLLLALARRLEVARPWTRLAPGYDPAQRSRGEESRAR
jgi:amidase